jgi:hypothetical protein
MRYPSNSAFLSLSGAFQWIVIDVLDAFPTLLMYAIVSKKTNGTKKKEEDKMEIKAVSNHILGSRLVLNFLKFDMGFEPATRKYSRWHPRGCLTGTHTPLCLTGEQQVICCIRRFRQQ